MEDKYQELRWAIDHHAGPGNSIPINRNDAAALLAERDALREALETARNGLQWYHDGHPEQVYECDHEAMAQINAALTL